MASAQKKSRDVPSVIQLSAEFQLSACDLVELPSAQLWDKLFPVVYSDFGNSERAGYGDLGAAEVFYDLGFVHPVRLHMLNLAVKDDFLSGSYPATHMETMGDRIRMLRQSKGLTQEQLGARLGVSKVSVSQWETGSTSNVRLETFLALCDELGTKPHYLVFGPENHRQLPRKRLGQ